LELALHEQTEIAHADLVFGVHLVTSGLILHEGVAVEEKSKTKAQGCNRAVVLVPFHEPAARCLELAFVSFDHSVDGGVGGCRVGRTARQRRHADQCDQSNKDSFQHGTLRSETLSNGRSNPGSSWRPSS